MALPIPWNSIEESISGCQDYGQGAALLANLFKGLEERFSPDEMLHNLFQGSPPRKWVERFCLCLCDTETSDKWVGRRALEGHRAFRLARRYAQDCIMEEQEIELAKQLIDHCSSRGNQSLMEAYGQAFPLLEKILNGFEIEERERFHLAFLMDCEGKALRLRVNWLSENADPYNMKTMARILPRLRLYDEVIDETQKLSLRISQKGVVGESQLSFEQRMRTPVFEKWMNQIGKKAPLRHIHQLLKLQRERRVPTRDLLALSTLTRWIAESKGEKPDPIESLLLAVKCWNDGGFSLEAGLAAQILRPVLQDLSVKIIDSRLEGAFHERMYANLVGKDLLSRPYARLEEEGNIDFKMLLAQNITRDGVMEALLSNPKVFQTPGLVTYITQMSRSVALLSRIAKSRSLHSGFANRDVPLALLQSPCTIPINLLRPFINSKYVALLDLKQLGRQRNGVRTDVRNEVDLYLKGRG